MRKPIGRPKDKIWNENVTKEENGRWKCKYCPHEFSGKISVTRIRAHLNKETGSGTAPCSFDRDININEGDHNNMASAGSSNPQQHVNPLASIQVDEDVPERIDASAINSSSNNRDNVNIDDEVVNELSPCAACKLLRRRCDEECVFAPYFHPTDPAKFTIAHRVFGASSIISFLQELPESQRADAVSSMVYEAGARIRDPVYGCVGAIYVLQNQVDVLQAQLAKAQAETINMQLQHQSESPQQSFDEPLWT